MQICLITTTIRRPEVLGLYRSLGPDVDIIVAGDRRSPHDEIRALLEPLGRATYLSDADQERMDTRCSTIIGWNKIQRRNLALLHAIRRRPDVIVTVDDDNIPVGTDYFSRIEAVLGQPFNGLAMQSHGDWFNSGELVTPRVWHRGFPYSLRGQAQLSGQAVVDQSVGVLAGLWLGDPDVDAMTRINESPIVTDMSIMAQQVVVAAPGTYTPFNSQNTAYLASLAPLMAVLPGVGRYDDIWAAYLAERIMRETRHVVAFGPPFVWQERNAQNLWRNLRDELMGMEQTDRFVSVLDEAPLDGDNIIDMLRSLYLWIAKHDDIPPAVSEMGLAWCDDVVEALE